MSYASAVYMQPVIRLDTLRIPGTARARALRMAAAVCGWSAFAVAIWTLLTAVMLLD